MRYFVVLQERGAAWDWAKPMRRQNAWDAHAEFMDALGAEGFIVAGGPLGEEDSARHVLHVVRADDLRSIETRLQADPWARLGLLETIRIEPWLVLIGTLTATDVRERPSAQEDTPAAG